MSIVEKALQKAQAKTERAAGSGTAQPEDTRSATVPDPTGSTIASRTPSVDARGGQVIIDVDRLRSEGRLAPAGLAQKTEDEFRRVKWPVLDAAARREGVAAAASNVVLVTSAIPGEGKTFTALNLALSIARERDRDVLLVDGDVAKPSLSLALGLRSKPGLTDLLVDEGLDVADVVHPTNIEGLSLVAAGASRDNAPELLSSDRMRTVIEALSARVPSGIVIFDSPPVLATNEAQVLSRYAGQVLLVILSDSTEQRMVTEALGLIDRNRPVNAVLNRVEPSLLSRYYSYYYYGYGRTGEAKS